MECSENNMLIKFRFTIWSAIGHESATCENSGVLIAFVFHAKIGDYGMWSSSIRFFPFMAGSISENERFRPVSLLCANMPWVDDVLGLTKKKECHEVASSIYTRVPLTNLLALLGRTSGL